MIRREAVNWVQMEPQRLPVFATCRQSGPELAHLFRHFVRGQKEMVRTDIACDSVLAVGACRADGVNIFRSGHLRDVHFPLARSCLEQQRGQSLTFCVTHNGAISREAGKVFQSDLEYKIRIHSKPCFEISPSPRLSSIKVLLQNKVD